MAIILITRRAGAIDGIRCSCSCSCSAHAAKNGAMGGGSCATSSPSSQLAAAMVVILSLFGVGAWSRPLMQLQLQLQGELPAAVLQGPGPAATAGGGGGNQSARVTAVARQQRGNRAVPALLVFGDSTVDPGNNNHLLTVSRSNFPPYGRDLAGTPLPSGRFSNGKLVTDYMASMAGLEEKTIPYMDTQLPTSKGSRKNLRDDGIGKYKILKHDKVGVSFASASSGFYDSTANHFNALPLSKQLSLFKEYKERLIAEVGRENASYILSKALYIVSTGTNDYINNYHFNLYLRARYTTLQFQALLIDKCAQFVKELYNLGARTIGVVSLPPLGCLPAQITLHRHNGCVEHLNDLAISFNKDLQRTISTLRMNLSDAKIAYMDSYTILEDAIKAPSRYGFKQVRKACCGSGKLEVGLFCNKFTVGTCKDASSYIFWDSFHPTDSMNLVLATKLFQKVWEELGIAEPYAHNYTWAPIMDEGEPKGHRVPVNFKWRWKIFLIGWLLLLVNILKQFFPKMISLGV